MGDVIGQNVVQPRWCAPARVLVWLLKALLLAYAALVVMLVAVALRTNKLDGYHCKLYMQRPPARFSDAVERAVRETGWTIGPVARRAKSPHPVLFPLFKWMEFLPRMEQDLFQTAAWRPMLCDVTARRPFGVCLVRTAGRWRGGDLLALLEINTSGGDTDGDGEAPRCVDPVTVACEGRHAWRNPVGSAAPGYLVHSSCRLVRTHSDIVRTLRRVLEPDHLFRSTAAYARGNGTRYVSILFSGDSIARGIFTHTIGMLRGDTVEGIYDRGSHGRCYYVATTRGDVLVYRSPFDEEAEGPPSKSLYHHDVRQRIIAESQQRLGGDVLLVMEYAFMCSLRLSDHSTELLREFGRAEVPPRSWRWWWSPPQQLPVGEDARDAYDMLVVPMTYPRAPTVFGAFEQDLRDFLADMRVLVRLLRPSQHVVLLTGPKETIVAYRGMCRAHRGLHRRLGLALQSLVGHLKAPPPSPPSTDPDCRSPHDGPELGPMHCGVRANCSSPFSSDPRHIAKNSALRALASELGRAWRDQQVASAGACDDGADAGTAAPPPDRGALVTLIDLDDLSTTTGTARFDHVHSHTNLYPHFPSVVANFRGQGEGCPHDHVGTAAAQLLFTILDAGHTFLRSCERTGIQSSRR